MKRAGECLEKQNRNPENVLLREKVLSLSLSLSLLILLIVFYLALLDFSLLFACRSWTGSANKCAA